MRCTTSAPARLRLRLLLLLLQLQLQLRLLRSPPAPPLPAVAAAVAQPLSRSRRAPYVGTAFPPPPVWPPRHITLDGPVGVGGRLRRSPPGSGSGCGHKIFLFVLLRWFHEFHLSSFNRTLLCSPAFRPAVTLRKVCTDQRHPLRGPRPPPSSSPVPRALERHVRCGLENSCPRSSAKIHYFRHELHPFSAVSIRSRFERLGEGEQTA